MEKVVLLALLVVTPGLMQWVPRLTIVGLRTLTRRVCRRYTSFR